MLTDEQLIDLLRTAGAQATVADPGPLAERILHREDIRHRRVRAMQYGLPALVAVLAIGLAGSLAGVFGGHRTPGRTAGGAQVGTSNPPGTTSAGVSASPSASAPATPSIRLAGYTVDLPADFTVDSVPAGCPAAAELTATERTRLVTTPGARCPILLDTVLAGLPAGATRRVVVVRPGESVVLYKVIKGNYLYSYLPVHRAGGGELFVTLDPRTPATADQYAQLQTGITVG